MLTKLRIRNFKQFEDVEIELGQNVVFIGANNSGKTSALQALALWYLGSVEQRVYLDATLGQDKDDIALQAAILGLVMTINRYDITDVPVSRANLLWRDLKTSNGEQIPVEIVAYGVDRNNSWSQGIQFRYINEESISCALSKYHRLPYAHTVPQVAFLTSMAGLASEEPLLQRGAIAVRIGQGRTAEVLRNLCNLVYENDMQTGYWDNLVQQMQEQFGIEILPPQYISGRGEIRMSYKDRNGVTFDLSSAGRGMLQVLLLLAYMYVNPRAVLLLDEPDAHLEIIRQREIYNLLTQVAREQGSQIIAASHSEIIMEEAAKKDVVIAFVGKPHRANDRRSQVEKALKSIPFDHYYQAERIGWVLYIEGSTDVAILKGFARKLGHAAADILDHIFIQPVNTNVPQLVRDHFYGLQEAKPDVVGYALFDRLDKQLGTDQALTIQMWQRREIENYLTLPEVLVSFARDYRIGDVFNAEGSDMRETIMRESIEEIETALRTLRRPSAWSSDIKATDDFLDPLFDSYFTKLKLPNLMLKTNYHVLTEFVPTDKIDPEVTEKLDAILAVASRAKPRED